jgi:hypothetical protein
MAPSVQASLYRRRCNDNIVLAVAFGLSRMSLSRMTMTGLI